MFLICVDFYFRGDIFIASHRLFVLWKLVFAISRFVEKMKFCALGIEK